MSNAKPIAVFGNNTDAGKTVVSAILVESLQATYWKPIQTGASGMTDRQQILQWMPKAKTYPEIYCLQHPTSPHNAARLEGISIEPTHLVLPKSSDRIIIETCGGALTPITDSLLQADMIAPWALQAVLVIRHYLGGINHALLTLEGLERRGIKLCGLIYNGAPYPDAERVISRCAQAPVIGRLLPEDRIDFRVIQSYAQQWRPHL